MLRPEWRARAHQYLGGATRGLGERGLGSHPYFSTLAFEWWLFPDAIPEFVPFAGRSGSPPGLRPHTPFPRANRPSSPNHSRPALRPSHNAASLPQSPGRSQNSPQPSPFHRSTTQIISAQPRRRARRPTSFCPPAAPHPPASRLANAALPSASPPTSRSQGRSITAWRNGPSAHCPNAAWRRPGRPHWTWTATASFGSRSHSISRTGHVAFA